MMVGHAINEYGNLGDKASPGTLSVVGGAIAGPAAGVAGVFVGQAMSEKKCRKSVDIDSPVEDFSLDDFFDMPWYTQRHSRGLMLPANELHCGTMIINPKAAKLSACDLGVGEFGAIWNETEGRMK